MIFPTRYLERRVALMGICVLLAVSPFHAVGASEENEATVHGVLTDEMQNAKLSMLFDGKTTDECRKWQEKFRKKLNQLLGDSTPPKQWRITEEGRSLEKNHTRYDLLLEANGVPSLPVYLLVPTSLDKGERAPGVLCVHGHGAYGNDPVVGRRDLSGVAEEIHKMNYDYGLQFVRHGYVVVAPCMIPFGRRVDRERYGGNDPCAVTFVRMSALGRLPITSNLRDLRWSIDLLASRAEVDPQRIGCAGLSYGGRMTMLVSAIDKRVRVAAISGALNLMQERMMQRYSCGSQVIPGLLQFGDYSEIGSLIAPRPCVWETGSNDGLIVAKWDDVFRKRLHSVYKAFGADDQLHFDRFVGGHEWSGTVAFPLFERVLKP